MKKTILTATLYTLITAILLGIGYPLLITAIDRVLFPRQASGELLTRNNEVIGSHLIGQTFTGDNYFNSRPSAAGTGYDATSSGGSNLSSTNKTLIDSVQARVQATASANPSSTPVPVDLVTASASGLDPDITPAAAYYQVARIAHARHLSESDLTHLIDQHTTQRQFGLLGEPRVNVLDLNLALDAAAH